MVIDLRTAKMRNYPLDKITVIPAERFLEKFPKNVVPVYILSKTGRKVLPAVVKNSKAATSIEVMRRAMPTVIAASPVENTHNIIHMSRGPIIQVASFLPAKTREQLLEHAIKKAEDVTAFGWMLVDLREQNISALEHFDPITMDIPRGTTPRRALQIQTADAMAIAGIKELPLWALKRILQFSPDRVKERIAKEKQTIWQALKRGSPASSERGN